MLLFLFSCKTANINILGIKTFNLSKSSKTQEKLISPLKPDKSDGIYVIDGNGMGTISGYLFTKDTTLLRYALVSFTLKKENYTEEKWIDFYSDRDGRFIIKNLPNGIYKIAATNDNAYLSVENSLIISQDKPLVELRMEIKPIE